MHSLLRVKARCILEAGVVRRTLSGLLLGHIAIMLVLLAAEVGGWSDSLTALWDAPQICAVIIKLSFFREQLEVRE